MENVKDEKLVSLVQQGHIHSYEILVNRYVVPLVNFLSHYVSYEDAQDIAQSSFIQVYKTIDRFDTKRKFSNYVYAVAKNCALSFLRTKHVHISIDSMKELESSEDVYLSYSKNENNQIVHQILRIMPGKYAKVLDLYYITGLTYEEIAQKMMLPINTIRTHIKRAKLVFKKTYEYYA